ncbi:MAG: phosphoribosyltransferase family protein [Syntrophaceae bacterium]
MRESIGMHAGTQKVIEIHEMQNRIRVFKNRIQAGRVLAGMLKPRCPPECIIYAIPSGGVPLGIEIAASLNLPLEIAVVSKITLPWNTEAGYGAVAFNGTAKLNRSLISRLHLPEAQVREGIESTLEKVRRRLTKFRAEGQLRELTGKTAVLVDDGIASGFTLLTGIEALKAMGPAGVYAASPTGSLESVMKVAAEADLVLCANIRSGWSFAVADAYEEWADIDESEAARMFTDYLNSGGTGGA